jgi:DNA polymerase I
LAKRVNFGIVYGMSSYGLSRELGIEVAEAENFINEYFERYKGVKRYMDDIYEQALGRGYVETLLGRRRSLSDILSTNAQSREFARRQAINTPIQGSCADLIKIAMVRIYQQLQKRGLKTKMIIQIHDELVFDVPGEEFDEVKGLAKEYMEKALSLNVPIEVNLKSGPNWGAMVKLTA